MNALLQEIKACTLCKNVLPFAPKPILNFSKNARIFIVGQAPGIKAHASGTPWNDASGDRLRDWLGVTREQFYDSHLFAIAPMGFCYPGRGSSGDLPPRPECSEHWMHQITAYLTQVRLTLVIGAYAQKYFLKNQATGVTETVKKWHELPSQYVPLPHPSPRNNLWLSKNPWFEAEVVPSLKHRVHAALRSESVTNWCALQDSNLRPQD